MQTDKTTRELNWWDSKTPDEQEEVINRNNRETNITRLYYLEHPEETETKKEEGKEGDILQGITPGQWYINQNLHVWGDDAKVADCSNNSQSTIYRLKSVQEMEANARLISLAPQLAKENKELKEELDLSNIQISTLQNKLSGCESALETAYEQNKLLREALAEIHGFLKVLPALRLGNKQGFDECVNIEGVKELELLASKALNQ